MTSRIRTYEDAYGAPTPAEVDAVAVAERSDERTIDDVYSDLGDWAILDFHPPPSAPTPGTDDSWPNDYRDVLSLVLDKIEQRIRHSD